MFMNFLYVSAACYSCYANDNDALIPEIWAMEALTQLEEKMMIAGLVNRDFEDEVKSFGDVVNTRRPGEFLSGRKVDGDEVVPQDAKLTNVRVPLDQHCIAPFVIYDGEESKSMQELINIHLVPAARSLARQVDRGLLGMVHKYWKTPDQRAGRLGNLNSSNAKDYILEAREILNVNKVDEEGRHLILSPSSETAVLKTDMFIAANQRGDGGTALENARLGRVLGFDTYLGVNTPYITAADTVTGTVTNALAAGATGSQTVSVTGYEVNPGEYVNIAGNDQPTYATAATASTNTTAVTLNEALKYATSAAAVLTVYKACDVKGAYATGYSKWITVDGWAVAPKQGQMISFGTGGSRHTYRIVEAQSLVGGEQMILLDRPLEAMIADNDLAFPGPKGSFNFAFHRDSLALVVRPLALPRVSNGVSAAVVSHNGVSIRIVMQYDAKIQGTRVNLDMLCGFAVLDDTMAVAFLG